jgi:hypothetical protein
MTAKDTSEMFLYPTAEGRAAARSSACALPASYRSILEALDAFDGIIPVEQLAERVPDWLPREIAELVADLEAIGLVEIVSMEWLVELYLLDGAATGQR